jgi:hypothetical protein
MKERERTKCLSIDSFIQMHINEKFNLGCTQDNFKTVT